MKHIFLTSSPFTEPGGPLNDSNGFISKFINSLPKNPRALIITSNPEDVEFTEGFSNAIKFTCEITGIEFGSYTILDNRNKEKTKELVNISDLIILAGGHTPTQNRFFNEIGLRDIIGDFDGTILGISAGSMNSADIVYATPEEEGEAVDPSYEKFLPGLNLTKTMLIPHYQDVKDNVLDGKKLFEEVVYPDSIGREFVAISDGSYLYSDGTNETIYGEAYLIKDGAIMEE